MSLETSGNAPGGSPAPSSPLPEGAPTGPGTGSSPLPPDLRAPGSPHKLPGSPPSTRRPRPSPRSRPTAASCRWALDDIGADRLAYGYAITAHRAQGTTVEVAHVLDDGGGRELAYVAMSRARNASHVYTTAPDLAQAAQRLTWSWDDERRQQWATDQARAAQRLVELRAEHRQLVGSIPPDVTDQLAHVRRTTGRPRKGPCRPPDRRRTVGEHTRSSLATRTSKLARRAHEENLRRVQDPHRGFLARHRSREDLKTSAATLQAAERAWQRTTEPHARLLEGERSRLAAQIGELEDAQQARAEFIKTHPELIDRINQLRRAIETQQASPHRPRPFARSTPTPPPIMQRRSLGPSYELPPTPAVPTGPEL